VAVLLTLVTIEPVLVLMVSIVFVPAWLPASRAVKHSGASSGA
jgi:hypothetical protein